MAPWSQETNGTYSVDGTYTTWNTFMPWMASSGFSFAGTLGSKDAVSNFNLQRFVFGDWKGIGTIVGGKGNLVLQRDDANYTVAWENASYGAINLNVTYNLANVKQWQMSATLRQKIVDDNSLLWAIKGTISLLSPLGTSDYIPLQFQ